MRVESNPQLQGIVAFLLFIFLKKKISSLDICKMLQHKSAYQILEMPLKDVLQ